jgi:hypothetical protein
VRGGGGSAIDTDERPREGEGCSWCASKGKWREGKRGATASGDTLLNDVVGVGVNVCMEELEGRRGGPGVAVADWQRPRTMPCRADRGARGLIGGPRPQCREAAPADRRARAAQCGVQTDSK